MEFIPTQLQPSTMTMAIIASAISTLWLFDQSAVFRGFVATQPPCVISPLRPCQVVTTCACRRNGGEKLSWVTDKLFRTMFLAVYSSVFFLPLWRLILPAKLLIVPLVLYLPSYLDGSEQRGGRKSMWMQQHWVWHWLKKRSPPLPSLICPDSSELESR